MVKIVKLFEPGNIGVLKLKNRIIFAPMVTTLATEAGEISDRQIEHYVERAKGEAGLIVVEASYPRSSGYPGRIMLRSESIIYSLRKLTEAIHREGAKVVCQINTHRGRQDEIDPASPSDIPNPITGRKPRQLSIDDIKKLEEEFGKGVRTVKEACFDGVMVHGSSGYLVSEFLSPLINRRTDKYGGSLENRARFALELVQLTREIAGPDYPIIFRLTADERVNGGFNVENAILFCKMLQNMSVDAIDVTVGGAESFEWTIPPMYLPPACNIFASEIIKRHIKIPVSVAGRINDPYLAEQILRDGKADFISIGRGLIADPQFPKKARMGRIDDIRKCIACLRCTESLEKHIPISCAVNPAVGKDREFRLPVKSLTEGKILIIGGGPAGMEAAIIAANRGHLVTLWEATDRLGGQLNLAALPPGKADISSLTKYLIARLKKLEVRVELNKRATMELVKEFAADAVIIATGSVPFIPDIVGISGDNVTNHREVLSGKKQIGKKIIIIGGGYLGCETADFLVEQNKDVTLTFRSPEPASDIKIKNVRKLLLNRLVGKVKMLANIKQYIKITQLGLYLVDGEGKELLLEADNIVLATGAIPDKTLTLALKGNVPRLYEVGDCAKVHGILEAIHGGAKTALQI